MIYNRKMLYVQKDSISQEKLLSRFLKYAKICTTSDSVNADKGIFPSTERQIDFAKILKSELENLGLSEVCLTENSYLYARLDATKGFENAKSFCLLSHLDTSEEVPPNDVNPIVHKNYDGSKIILNETFINPQDDEELLKTAHQNDTIITSDGNTLLGTDDKAGIAEIVTAIEYIIENKIPHGTVEVIFSPDEETGHGMDKVPLNLLKSKHAYTVDGGSKGELETECFNAYSAKITFYGKSTHTGTARKGKMINAISVASAFIQNLPHNELPETTDGYMGFFAPLEISGTVEKASVYLLLRDFTEDGMQKRISLIKKMLETLELSTNAKTNLELTEQYKNMKEVLQKSPFVVEILKKAYESSGVEPIFSPIRGGTDGSRLCEMGIATPNIFTGGHNFHSRTEWASLNQMTDALNVLINLIILHTEQ